MKNGTSLSRQAQSGLQTTIFTRKLIKVKHAAPILMLLCLALLFMSVSDVSAAQTGWISPTSIEGGNNVQNPANAYSSNNQYAVFDTTDDIVTYVFPTFNIPSGAIITGIEVQTKGNRSNWNNPRQLEIRPRIGSTTVGSLKTTTFSSTSDQTITLGSASDLWGYSSWTAASFAANTFKLIADATLASGDLNLDHIQVRVHYTENTPNPPLAKSCGLDIALVLDRSGSINSTQLSQMRAAFIALVDALEGTGTQFSVTHFGQSATAYLQFTSDSTAVKNAINANPNVGQFTNWEAGIEAAQSTFASGTSNPNLMLFATDGDPNRPTNEATGLSNAITAANAAKTAGTRMLAFGIGTAPTLANLQMISGSVVNGTTLATTDVITSAFDDMAARFRELASEMCGGTITVTKLIDVDGAISKQTEKTTVLQQADGPLLLTLPQTVLHLRPIQVQLPNQEQSTLQSIFHKMSIQPAWISLKHCRAVISSSVPVALMVKQQWIQRI